MLSQRGPSPAPPITVDVLMRALKENMDFIVSSLTFNMNAIAKKVDENTSRVEENTAAISRQAEVSSAQRTDIDRLEERVKRLESGGASAPAPSISRARLSHSYLHARRSVRFWPVEGDTDEAIWENVGDFIHDTLMVNTADVGQDDIEDVRRVDDSAPMSASDRREVVVTFFVRRKRDTVVANSVNLASWTDPAGKPTAGIRLEVPSELEDTFRLLSRFGTRLRARHGV